MNFRIKRNPSNRWIVYYILITVISGLSSFVVQMVSTGLPLYCIEIGKTTAESGIFAGFYSASLILSRPFVGKWTDEKGKWNIAIIGTLLMVVSFAGMAFFQKLSFYSIYQLLEGFAFSAMSTALAAMVVDVLPTDAIVKGIGLFTVAKSLTISLGASFAVSFIEKYGANKIFACCFVMIVIAFVLVFLIKKQPVYEKEVVKQEEEENYEGIEKFIDVHALPICLIQFVFTFSLTLATSYLPSYAQSIGLVGIGSYYTVSAITMFLSRTVFDKLLEKLDNRKSFIVGMILAILTTIDVLFSDKLIYFLLLSIPNAIGICLINPTLNVMATANVPSNRRGVASSTYYASLDLGSGMGSMLWGIFVPIIGYKKSFIGATIFLIGITLYGMKVWKAGKK